MPGLRCLRGWPPAYAARARARARASARRRPALPPGPGTDSLTLDFATVVYRLQLLGFNAVRLPFSFTDLYDTPPKSQTRSCPQARAQLVHARCARRLRAEARPLTHAYDLGQMPRPAPQRPQPLRVA